MRVPSAAVWGRYVRAFALLICGGIIGSSVFMMIYQHNMDELIDMHMHAKERIRDLLMESEDLKKYKDQQTIIRTIMVKIEESSGQEPLPEVVKNELRAKVHQDLQFLKGQPIVKIIPNSDNAPQTLKHLYHKVHSNIHGNNYQVTISTMIVVYGELRVWVRADEFEALP
ncbi:hypothetical protein [Marinicrinis sediminis]|uniref:Sporulation membrane protein YtrI C-terminal domain-containing protein n=1 Tax=Marinicrinis sediminis TaxID=1652465 RepID=A0ABW5R8Y5_9BACL